MINGTYTAHFESSLGSFGDGVVTVHGTRISGGDSMYRYSGTFTEAGEMVRARIAVRHYAGTPSSVFGPLKAFNLDLRGAIRNGAGRLDGVVVGQPHLRIAITLKLVEQVAAE